MHSTVQWNKAKLEKIESTATLGWVWGVTFKSTLGLSLFENIFWFKEFQHPLNNLHNLRDCEVGNCAKVQV